MHGLTVLSEEIEMKKIYLVLGQGSVFEGYSFGADAQALGEIVFNTGVCGYLETLTDAAYAGQIVVQTFPLIGNYGVIEEDLTGDCFLKGYVVREWCEKPSNFRSQYDIDTFLKKRGIVGIYGVDTREITRLIREYGPMNAMICSSVPDDLSVIQDYEIGNLLPEVVSKDSVKLPCKGDAKYESVIVSLGSLHHIPDELAARGCNVTILPYNADTKDILAAGKDGIVISDGPCDPEKCDDAVEAVKALAGKKPILGIGMGHEILALAKGGKTFRLKCGHRGGNQPVRETRGTRTYITTQNHGYAVDPDKLPRDAYMSLENINDDTCAGVEYEKDRSFGVQFIPEGDGSAFDTSWVYDKFIKLMGGEI